MILAPSTLNWSYEKPTFEEVKGKTITISWKHDGNTRVASDVIDCHNTYMMWFDENFLCYAIIADPPEPEIEPMELWGMKPEDRKRLKQHIEMIVEHKMPEETTMSYNEDIRNENKKLRLELATLRFKESQEQRFIWWIWNVYSRNVCDLIYAIMGATTYDTEGEAKEGKYALPKHCFDLMKKIDEYTEHIYDGTYLDVS